MRTQHETRAVNKFHILCAQGLPERRALDHVVQEFGIERERVIEMANENHMIVAERWFAKDSGLAV